MIEIRRATAADALFISLLARVTFEQTFADNFTDKKDLYDYLEYSFNVQKIRSSLENKNNCYWIAFWKELPVGYAKLKVVSASTITSSTNTSQLQKIYVLREFLDKKIGKSLLDVLVNHFKMSDKDELWLSVLKSNHRAIQFYNSNGFHPIGDHKFVIGKETFYFDVLSIKNNENQ